MGAGAVGRVGEDEAGTLKAQLAALMQQTTHSAVIVLQVDQPQKVESIDTTQDKPRFKKHSFARQTVKPTARVPNRLSSYPASS